ncbi:MAG: hypothetical protein M0D53_14280 [Flavobacterium sp. JAD_PAG50586_2]|nr:MAG: hypothetical protein M0D53_14280 [Flavobacterium sp. JAD_PAG50586_2]
MATKTMNLDLVQQMTTNYQTKQLLSILTNTVNPMTFDAKSVWFGLDELKDFIATIEAETAKHPEYGMKDLGVRFYYSAYPASVNWEDPGYETLSKVPSNYEKLHTLIGIPTALINNTNQDFDPADVKTYDGSKPKGVGISIMAENHGELIPPGGNQGTWF